MEKYIKEFKGGSMAKTFLMEKDNSLFVRKEVEDISGLGLEKLEKQANWILSLEPGVSEIFPKVIQKSFKESFGYYDMDFYDMPSFRDYLINVGEVNNDIKKMLQEIVSYCHKISLKEEISSQNKQEYIEKMHFNKMIKRCEIVNNKDEIFNSFFNKEYLTINGKDYLNLKQLLSTMLLDKQFIEFLSPKSWRRSHGDFTFQNILTDGKEFAIIDPRGEGEDSVQYDLSKLFQSCNGKYDLLFKDNYTVDFSINDNQINYEIINHESLFDEVFTIIKDEISKTFVVEYNWELVTLFFEASHFVSMVPFRYEENLAFTLCCYAVGVKMLNDVYEAYNKIYNAGDKEIEL